jgi:choline dehydrogenase-like flavoprotein
VVIDAGELSEDRTDHNFDVCIIGGGTAGLPLGQSLADRGLNVAILEGGGFASSGANDPDPAQERRPNEPVTQRGWVRGVGGTSRIWGGRLVELDPAELQPRPYVGQAGWPLSLTELNRHTADVESLFHLPTGAFRRDAGWAYETFAQRPAEPRAVEPSYPVIVQRRFRDVSRVLNAPAGSRQPTVFANATVSSFITDAETGRLQAVEAQSLRGNRVSIRARHFVLAAGAVESTRLLLWLDREASGRVFSAPQNLGHYFQDHIAVPAGTVRSYEPRLLSALLGLRSRDKARRVVHFGLSADLQRQLSLPNAYLNFQVAHNDARQMERIRTSALGSGGGAFGKALRAFRDTPRDIPFAALLSTWYLLKTAGYRPRTVDVVAQIVIEQLPQYGNAISLSGQLDRFGVPTAKVAWEVSSGDHINMLSAQSIYRDFWDRSGLTNYCAVRWHDLANAAADMIGVFHPCGSIAMGLDPKSSVVGPDLSCHAVKNLSVLSTAVFPSTGSGNPTMTLLQLTYRLSAQIAHDLAGGTQAAIAA